MVVSASYPNLDSRQVGLGRSHLAGGAPRQFIFITLSVFVGNTSASRGVAFCTPTCVRGMNKNSWIAF